MPATLSAVGSYFSAIIASVNPVLPAGCGSSIVTAATAAVTIDDPRAVRPRVTSNPNVGSAAFGDVIPLSPGGTGICDCPIPTGFVAVNASIAATPDTSTCPSLAASAIITGSTCT